MCTVAPDLELDIINICHRKLTEANTADRAIYDQLHWGDDVWGWYSNLQARETAVNIDRLNHFFWVSRADMSFGPVTLTSKTGAVVVYGADKKEEIEA